MAKHICTSHDVAAGPNGSKQHTNDYDLLSYVEFDLVR